MKTLILVRHAKSSWKDNDQDDHERPLNKRGNRDSLFMAKTFANKKIHPDLIASSTAVRALKTAYAFADALKTKREKILRVSELYLADRETFLQYVMNLDDEYKTVMLFGHNPGITHFANALIDSEIENIPTCGIVSIQLKKKSWSEIESGKSELDFFIYPKMYFKDSED